MARKQSIAFNTIYDVYLTEDYKPYKDTDLNPKREINSKGDQVILKVQDQFDRLKGFINKKYKDDEDALNIARRKLMLGKAAEIDGAAEDLGYNAGSRRKLMLGKAAETDGAAEDLGYNAGSSKLLGSGSGSGSSNNTSNGSGSSKKSFSKSSLLNTSSNNSSASALGDKEEEVDTLIKSGGVDTEAAKNIDAGLTRYYTGSSKSTKARPSLEGMYSDLKATVEFLYAVDAIAGKDSDASNRIDLNRYDSLIQISNLSCGSLDYESLMSSLAEASQGLADTMNASGYESLSEAMAAAEAASSSSSSSGSSSSSSSDSSSSDSSSSDSSSSDSDNDSYGSQGDSTSASALSASFEQCAIKSAALLAIICVILIIIEVLRKVVSIVMQIGVTACALVSKIVNCWVDPPSIADAVQYLMDTVIALLKKVIQLIIKNLWDSLNLNCISDATASLLSQVKSIISGLSAVDTTADQVLFSVSNANQSISNALDALNSFSSDSYWEEAYKSFAEDVEEANANVKKFFSDETANDILGYTQVQLTAYVGGDVKNVKKLQDALTKAKANIAAGKREALESASDGSASGSVSRALKASSGFDNVEII